MTSAMSGHDHCDRRPFPKACRRSPSESRDGQIAIFLGAAWGVGKTYEALAATQDCARDGTTNVAIGVPAPMTQEDRSTLHPDEFGSGDELFGADCKSCRR